MIVWFLLAYTDGAAAEFIGINVDGEHKNMADRFNKVAGILGGKYEIANEFTYLFLSMMASYISFTVVKPCMNFGFYFFCLTRAASKGNDSFRQIQSENRRFSFKNLIRLLYANFFAPVVIAFLFI